MPRDDRERRDWGAVLSLEWNSERAEVDAGCKSIKGLGSILMLLLGLSVGLPLSCAFLWLLWWDEPGG
jgi:hypothetical protein